MDKVVYVGRILTLEEPLYTEAMLIQDGVIFALGSKKEVLEQAGKQAQVVELGNNVLMPAFIDAHSHFAACANGMFQVPLEEAISFEEIKQRIHDHIKNNQIQPGEFVLAKGYDHNHLEEKVHPTKELLDQAAPYNPVIIQHQSGHMGVMNSLALEKFGITIETQPPEGGMIEQKNGQLTGYMEENAFIQYLKMAPMPTMQEFLQAFEKAQQMYASYGITTIQEGMLVEELAELYRPLLDNKLLWLDVVGYGDLKTAESLKKKFSQHIGQYKDHFRFGGYKIFLDGSPQGKTAWMLHPYKNAEDGYCGYPTMTNQQVKDAVALAVGDNMQILAHCNGDAAAEQYISAAEQVEKEQPHLKEIKPVLVHAQLTTGEQLQRAAKIGMIPSFFVAHVYHWGDVHIKNFGFERAKDISMAATASRLGMTFTFHQDSPVIPPNMLETIWCAVNRITKAGVVLGEEQKLSPLEAVKAVTIYAARQYSEESTKGSLAVGKQADLVVLSDDPLQVAPEEIRNIQVLQTIKKGKVVYSGTKGI